LSVSFDTHFYFGYLFCGLSIFFLVFFISRVVNKNTSVAAAHATTASLGNLGFLGPPIMLAFFGARGAGPLAMAITVEVMILLSLGSALMSVSENAHAKIGQIIFRSTLLNPVVLAILVGVALAATNTVLPRPLEQFLTIMGGAAGPTALFALGVALAVQKIDRAGIVAALSIAVAKLALYPVLIWLVLAKLLGLDPFWWQTGVVIAAMPSAGHIFVLAQRYRADPERVSAVIVASTVISVVTVPFVAWLVLD
jgi:predicted permease